MDRNIEPGPTLFDTIASRYDFATFFISFGLCSFWHASFIETIFQSGLLEAGRCELLLDLCCGTGAITKKLIRRLEKRNMPVPYIFGVDYSSRMLGRAQKTCHSKNTQFVHADATALPFPDEMFDIITISYGVRNFSNPHKAFSEMKRVLKPAGRIFVLELTAPSNHVLRALHQWYLSKAVPLLGSLCTFRKKPYEYLGQSIERFSAEKILALLSELGLACLPPRPQTGGIASIFEIYKQ